MNTFQKVKRVAAANPYGFTISLTTFKAPAKGWVIALKETQNSFGDSGLKRVIEVAARTTQHVGGWKDEKSGRFYYDCVMIVDDEAEAIRLGIENEQIAIYNLETQREIRL